MRQQVWENRSLMLVFSMGTVRAFGQCKFAEHLPRGALSHHAGTGGDATASWLVDNLAAYVEKHWESGGKSPELDITEAFIKARPVPVLVNTSLCNCLLLSSLSTKNWGQNSLSL